MKKFIRFFTTSILLSLCLIMSVNYSAKALEELRLIENAPNNNTLPDHFRLSNDYKSKIKDKSINLKGLDKLNISGSGQFSDSGLSLIKDAIKNKFYIIDIDLRQESHGFVNGIAISWEAEKNDANKGLNLPEVIAVENKLLSSIKIGEPLTFSNKKETVIPKLVQTEEQVAKSKDIGYIRIPVTDGGFPTDDMIEYFIDFVQNQPKNSWLHFHCKEGIGRTTTFMIMYDLIKNHKDVSLNDIIKRQVILSGMDDIDAQGFYTGEHYKFLNDFYNKYIVKSTSSIEHNTFINDNYIKNTIMPEHLYVISEDKMTNEEQIMISALQGIISTKSKSQIYILSKYEPDYKVWLDDLISNYNISSEYISNPWELIDKFKYALDGYILYDNSNLPSINNACTLASLNNSIPIEKSLETKINNCGLSNLIKDCSKTDKYWAYKNFWNSGLNHSTVIQLSPEKTMALRDYAIMSKSLIFYEDDINDTSLRSLIFKSMDNTPRVLGWGPDEYNNVSIASSYGVDIIAADWSYNLSVLSSFPTTIQTQKSNEEIPKETNVHYITFIMSDGDNQQWLLGSNYSSENWFGSKNRGNFNLGWSLSPSLYYLAPTVFEKYYESANSSPYSDYYLVSPSGNGYIYPSKYPINKLSNYTNRLSEYMKTVDQKYVLIIDDNSFYKNNLWHKYTDKSNIDGLFYLDYQKGNNYNGKITWSNDKPIVSCRDLLWEGLENEDELVDNINSRTKLDYIDISSPDSYTFVYIHVWSKDLNALQSVINKLSTNPKVRVVTPDAFMKLIKCNIKPT